MIGFLMLMGIVAKNAILLVDFAIEEMRAGKDRLTAILEATHKRARPIVMTTVAMIAGMLPVAVGLGGDTSFRQPMAVAVIGGLITSTALTLVIVPALFTVVDDIERWLAPKFGRVLTAQPTPAGSAPAPSPGQLGAMLSEVAPRHRHRPAGCGQQPAPSAWWVRAAGAHSAAAALRAGESARLALGARLLLPRARGAREPRARPSRSTTSRSCAP